MGWKRGTDETRHTENTGPSSAHDPSDSYLYIDASDAGDRPSRYQGDEAILLAMSQAADTMSLWYHMKGSAIGSLHVDAKPHGPGNWGTVWSQHGDKGDKWLHARDIVLGCTEPCDVRIRGIRGNGHQGDIAIDDVLLQSSTHTCDHFVKGGMCGGGDRERNQLDDTPSREKCIEKCKSVQDSECCEWWPSTFRCFRSKVVTRTPTDGN